MSEIFESEDYHKLVEIFNLLWQSVALLEQKYPDNYGPIFFENRLEKFETEYLDQLDQLVQNDGAPDDFRRFGIICFKELDIISEAIYAYIDKMGCGKDMQMIANENIF